MYLLIFSLLFVQQAVGTESKIQLERIPGFSTEKFCDDAGKALVKTHTGLVNETTTDYDSSEHDGKDQPDDEKFATVRPYYTCIYVK